MFCVSCARALAGDDRFCGGCGAVRASSADLIAAAGRSAVRFCRRCGQVKVASDAVCGSCGTPVDSRLAAPRPPVYAHLGLRLIAAGIDLVLITYLWFLLIVMLTPLLLTGSLVLYLALLALSPLLPIGYLWWGYASGGSLGKRIAGIRVVRDDGATPGAGLGFVRLLDAIVTIPLTAGLGLLRALGDPNRQTLHDRLAGTIVVRR